MDSIFIISNKDCISCNNQVIKAIGTLQGVFGAEIDRIRGRILVSHTDEVTHEEIDNMLDSLGLHDLKKATSENHTLEPEIDVPSIWGCTL